jgi:hypothetical protein
MSVSRSIATICAPTLDDRTSGRALLRGEGQFDFEPRRVFDDVGVRDDVAGAVDDDSGSAGSFEDGLTFGSRVFIVAHTVAGDEDLDDGGTHFVRELLEGTREVGETRAGLRGGRRAYPAGREGQEHGESED